MKTCMGCRYGLQRLVRTPLSRCMSTKAATKPVKQEVEEYSFCSKDPTAQDTADLLKFYSISPKHIQDAFVHGYSRQFQYISECVQEHTMLVRKPALDIIQTLNHTTEPSPRFLLYGPDGSGKSVTLMHILHYCYLKDWLILHVPDGNYFADSHQQTTPQQSSWKPHRLDQPEESMQWLKAFRSLNMRFLTELKTSQHYSWGKREATEKDQPLLSVIEQGLSRGSFATDAVGVLLKEIQLQKSCKVLYAVDKFNSFFGKTAHKIGKQTVDIKDVALIRHFTKLLETDRSLHNGCYMMTLSLTGAYRESLTDRGREIEDILSEEALSLCGAYTPVKVDNYSQDEFENILRFYRAKGWISRDLSKAMVDQLHFLTNRNPLSVKKICANL